MNILKKLKNMLLKKITPLVLVGNMAFKRTGKNRSHFLYIFSITYYYCLLRMDKSAVGHDYVAKVEKHGSQTDAAKGFGGKFGVQTDRVDKVFHQNMRIIVLFQLLYSYTHYILTFYLDWLNRVLLVGIIRRSW